MKSDFPWVLMAGQIGRYIWIYIPTLKSAPQDHQREEVSLSLISSPQQSSNVSVYNLFMISISS